MAEQDRDAQQREAERRRQQEEREREQERRWREGLDRDARRPDDRGFGR